MKIFKSSKALKLNQSVTANAFKGYIDIDIRLNADGSMRRLKMNLANRLRTKCWL